MKTIICGAVALTCSLPASPSGAQDAATNSSPAAILISDADMQARLKEMITSKLRDEPVRVVRGGDSNTAVFLVHLDPEQAPKGPVTLSSHDDVSEVYYVIKGEGTLYHGGTFENPVPRFSATTSGPGLSGTTKGTLTQKVGPGDAFIVVPNTPHMVLLGPRTEMVYLVVRSDPKKHLKLK